MYTYIYTHTCMHSQRHLSWALMKTAYSQLTASLGVPPFKQAKVAEALVVQCCSSHKFMGFKKQMEKFKEKKIISQRLPR